MLAEERKNIQIIHTTCIHAFTPMAIEAPGLFFWGGGGGGGGGLAKVVEARFTTSLIQRLSMVMQCENAASVIGLTELRRLFKGG